MATYTEHYGLHQWEPTDDFLRTDFNTDFGKIDAALHGKADTTALEAMKGLIDEKCKLITGTYVGNGSTQQIDLGRMPRVAGLGIGNYCIMVHEQLPENGDMTANATGFQVIYDDRAAIPVNRDGRTYAYWALV